MEISSPSLHIWMGSFLHFLHAPGSPQACLRCYFWIVSRSEEAFATLFSSMKCNSLRHRLWLVLVSNCWHEQQARASTAAFNISSLDQEETHSMPKARSSLLNNEYATWILCTSRIFTFAGHPKISQVAPQEVFSSSSGYAMPSKDTWGMCNVRCVLVLATFPTKGFSTNVET